MGYYDGYEEAQQEERARQQLETVHEWPVVPIDFGNPSDNLFARLFVND